VIAATFAILGVAALGFLYRLLRGPSLADRVVGFDGVVTVLVITIVADSVRTGSADMLPIVVLLAVLGFSSTALVGRYIEAGDRDR
jgi:multicomponent Na+:H+ antiporter subunit F